MIDCDLLYKVYINLIGQKEPSFHFKNELKKNTTTNKTLNNYSKIVIKPSIEEIKEHKIFLDKELKKNFF